MLRLRALVGSVSRAIVTTVALLAPQAARAQDNVPPPPSLSRTAAPWLGFVIMFLLLALVVSVSLMPSKRGHQD